MITYKTCTEQDYDLLFEAFTKGFSDYMVKFTFTKEIFIENFFKVEQNSLEHSLLAFDDEKPIGIMLGGIKVYDGVKTLRCGTLAIDPEYRKKGIASSLFNLHKEIALKNNCKQLFLEVIKGNDKAINFYLKNDYKINYDITYYRHTNPSELKIKKIPSIEIKSITLDILKDYYLINDNTHINWQNDFDYQGKFKNINFFGAFDNDKLIGAISISNNGRIFYLHVKTNNRFNYIGSYLLSYAYNVIKSPLLVMSFTNNFNLKNFFIKLGFKEDALSQYEMHLPLF